MPTLDRWIAYLVYASVAVGVAFLAAAYGLIPYWLYYTILGGELAYVLCAVVVTLRVRWAPYLALALAVLTLAVSLPQPEHYEFAQTGLFIAFSIFSLGSIIQVCLIVAVALWIRRSRMSKAKGPQTAGGSSPVTV